MLKIATVEASPTEEGLAQRYRGRDFWKWGARFACYFWMGQPHLRPIRVRNALWQLSQHAWCYYTQPQRISKSWRAIKRKHSQSQKLSSLALLIELKPSGRSQASQRVKIHTSHPLAPSRHRVAPEPTPASPMKFKLGVLHDRQSKVFKISDWVARTFKILNSG